MNVSCFASSLACVLFARIRLGYGIDRCALCFLFRLFLERLQSVLLKDTLFSQA